MVMYMSLVGVVPPRQQTQSRRRRVGWMPPLFIVEKNFAFVLFTPQVAGQESAVSPRGGGLV